MTEQQSDAFFDPAHPRRRMSQNVLLLWLDVHTAQSNNDCQEKLAELQSVVNDVYICTQREDCVDFLTDITDKKAFLIVEGSLSKNVLPLMYDIPQLHTIYIFCRNKSKYEEWAKAWVKVKGIHTEMMPLCQALQLAVNQDDKTEIAISFLSLGEGEGVSSANLNQLEPSFMYTQLFKEILLQMNYDDQSTKNFTAYCRKNNYGSLININRFESDYRPESAIWWYTYQSFVYSLLNYALRSMEADTIIHMGFIVHDLHHQIKHLHHKQVNDYHGKPFTVYRGQRLSITDFEKLRKTKRGLISFNNFLSTSKEPDISLPFVKAVLSTTDTVGILFRMSIDPSISTTPFAAIQEVSYFKTEEEVLFSMHTVFRIGEIKQLDSHNLLYQVDLELTSDVDEQLRRLTKYMREETADATGWKQLGSLLLKIRQLNKAEELYNVLLEQTSNMGEKTIYYNQLGYIKDHQGDYEKAIFYYEKVLNIFEKNFPANHPALAISYNNIGMVYQNMGENFKALSFHEKGLEIRQKTFPPNHLDLAISYNNIGMLYDNMGENSKALSFYEKALEIQQKILLPNHPSLTTSYSNIAGVYDNMREYSRALSYHEKALEIDQKTLPPNHPDLATSYNNIGLLYKNMGDYSKALSFFDKAFEIQQKALPPNHPALATSYNNIGLVYKNMGNYLKALSYFDRGLDIRQRSLPLNHPSIQDVQNTIEDVKKQIVSYF